MTIYPDAEQLKFEKRYDHCRHPQVMKSCPVSSSLQESLSHQEPARYIASSNRRERFAMLIRIFYSRITILTQNRINYGKVRYLIHGWLSSALLFNRINGYPVINDLHCYRG